jgi:hypothetical protein
VSTEHTSDAPDNPGALSTPGTPAESAAPDAPDGSRQRRSRLIITSVVAAVLLAGGGGAYWATAASTTSDGEDRMDAEAGGSGESDPPPLALYGYPDGTAQGIAPGEPAPDGTLYKAEGKLPEGPDSAAVHRASGEVTAEEVARLAQALEVPGKPRLEGGAWRVGAVENASGSALTVNQEAPGTWSFSRQVPGGHTCVEPGGPARLPESPEQRCPAPNGGDIQDTQGRAVISEKAAKAAAAPVLKAVGQDEAKLDASQVLGAVRTVNADPVIDGLPTHGWTTGVQVGSDGRIVGGSGRLKEPKKGPEYPLISAKETLKELNSPIVIGCATPVPLEGEQKENPCAPSSGAPRTVTVKEAVFGLSAQFVDGQQALVPSWLFEVKPQEDAADTYTVTHPAVEPEFLKPSAPGPRAPEPKETDQGAATKPTTLPIDSYSVEGKTLKVTFTGGVCHDFSVKTEKQQDDAVTVRVTSTPRDPAGVCIALAKEFTKSVQLDEPLGDRKVLDASSSKAVPKKK